MEYYQYKDKKLIHKECDSYWEDVIPEVGSTFYWGDLEQTNEKPTEENKKELYAISELLSGGDYSNSSTVELSNHRTFLDAYKDILGIHDVYGSFGSFAVAIRLDVLDSNPDIKKTLDSLENNPVLDDGDLSELEMELSDEAWKNWAEHDFSRALQNSHPLLEECELDDNELKQLFETCADEANEYWQAESGGSMYIRIEKIVPYARDHLIVKLTPAKDLPLLIGYDWVSERAEEEFMFKLKG